MQFQLRNWNWPSIPIPELNWPHVWFPEKSLMLQLVLYIRYSLGNQCSSFNTGVVWSYLVQLIPLLIVMLSICSSLAVLFCWKPTLQRFTVQTWLTILWDSCNLHFTRWPKDLSNPVTILFHSRIYRLKGSVLELWCHWITLKFHLTQKTDHQWKEK